MDKQQFVMLMMGNFPGLDPVVPKVHDSLKELVQQMGSVEKLSEALVNYFGSLLLADKVKNMIHEGFDPVMCAKEVIQGHLSAMMMHILDGPREMPFAQWKAPFEVKLQKLIGETVEELEDGFQNGQEGVWALFGLSLEEYNVASAPP